uniref:C-type lectin domain-containing protein n=1 Tax=Terrapene triunguis TaxID=2587831 RepID=A0A674JC20_9SAUR
GERTAACPTGWLHFQGDCYGYFPQEATWRRAEARCQSFGSGAHLAAIHSEEEHNAVAGFIARSQRHDDDDDDGDDVWIGLHIPVRVRAWCLPWQSLPCISVDCFLAVRLVSRTSIPMKLLEQIIKPSICKHLGYVYRALRT